MEKKLTIIEIIIVVIAAIIYLFISVLPNFKKTIGTSDHFIKTSSYLNMYEINIDNKVNFAFIEDNEEKIYHILFFDENSTCLYNQNIEKKYVNDATTETIKILIENNYLNSKSVLSITRYNENGYINFKNIFIKNLKEYNINNEVIELENTLENKTKDLLLESSKDDEANLRTLDYYSKNIARTNKNIINNKKESIYEETITKENSKTYTNNVYKKIEKYVLENNIKYIDNSNTSFPIYMIPVDDNEKYYPTENSWYYVQEGKIYAYIEIKKDDDIYGYCYNGSIDRNNEGKCLNEKTS